MADPHSPTTLSNYVHVHDSYMAKYVASGFVTRNDCDFTYFKHSTRLDGTIECEGRITIDVKKDIEHVNGTTGWRAIVCTRSFNYHAMCHARDILRYDCKGDHRPFPHKHIFDFFGDGRELKSQLRYLTNPQDVPTLGGVIEELRKWYDANRRQLHDD